MGSRVAVGVGDDVAGESAGGTDGDSAPCTAKRDM